MSLKSETIQSEEDLSQMWTDPNCPSIAWGFNETSLDQCLRPDGTYVATYETLEVPEGQTISFTYLTESGEVTYQLQSGEYGVRS